MADPAFDDPGPPIPEPARRARRALTVAVLLTLVVSMVFLAFVSGRGLAPVPPPVTPRPSVAVPPLDASRLAIVDTAGRLSTTDALGGSVVRYGQAGVAFSFPAWSPDGTRIAAIGAGADETAVYLFAVPTPGAAVGDPAIVYRSSDQAPIYLYWAPDSRTLTFLTSESVSLALRSVGVDAGAPVETIRHGSPMYWTWADPTRLLVHSDGEGIGGFFGEVDAAGVSVEREAIVPGGFRVPAVTTDGRFRAFVTPGEGSSEQVTVENRDGSSMHSVDVFGAAAIDFGPGTSELAFIAPAQSSAELPLPVGPLRLLDGVTGTVRTLIAGPVLAFFWAPDGRTIATIQVAAPGDDKVARAGRATLARMGAASTATNRLTAEAGQSLRVAFVNVESGAVRSRWSFRVSDTFVQQLLPFFDQYALSHRLWSADSASMALPIVADDGTSQLMVVRADGSDARRVADAVAGFWSP
ncbi:MAG: hypothetical protein ABJC39_06310 [Chloroflexota bacterium]